MLWIELAHASVLIISLVLLIPISAIVLGIGSGMIKTIVQSQERKLQMKLNAKQREAAAPNAIIEELRAEIAQLRDTSTQHSMSLQHSIDSLEQRMEYVERNTSETNSTVQQGIRR